ncbi:hypothetical protein L2E82_35451 [Cichorium intybus]|uniref:Uncharacterized protein n=1 Tax=Cichorium intybus TaxID=13427 RepID=A0ACB9BNW1_CICIN|nr:hypothetical protein L2E82_35451 [Cichorium intybus]
MIILKAPALITSRCERCSINDGSNDLDPPSSMVGRSRSHPSNQVKEISNEKQRLKQSDYRKIEKSQQKELMQQDG